MSGAEQGAAPEAAAGTAAPAPLAGVANAGALAGAPQGPTPLLHPTSSAPAPATIWVPDSTAAVATLSAFPPRPAQPATSAPQPTWLPPSPFSAVLDSGGGSALPALRSTASAPLPTLSPFSSGGFDSGPAGDAAQGNALQPATLGLPQPALCGLPSGGFGSVTSPIQLSAAPPAAPQALQLPRVQSDALGGMHQPALPPQPPSPLMATPRDGWRNEDEDPLLRYLLEDDAFAAESLPSPVPAGPPAPRPLGPAACLVRARVVPGPALHLVLSSGQAWQVVDCRPCFCLPIACTTSVLLSVHHHVMLTRSYPCVRALPQASAVLAQRPKLVRCLLAGGAPPNFRLSELPQADVAAMEAGGIHLTGYQHMTPLMVAVQQLNADVATALLEGGAAVRPEPPAGGSGSPSGRAGRAHRRPLLLQLLDATAAAAADAAAAAAGPAPAQARDPAGGHTAAAAPAGSGSMAAAASGEPDMAAAASAGSEAVLDASCRLLAALLAHGADPLEQDPTTSRQPTTFLSGECVAHVVGRGQLAVRCSQVVVAVCCFPAPGHALRGCQLARRSTQP